MILYSQETLDVSITGIAFDYLIQWKQDKAKINGYDAEEVLDVVVEQGKVYSRMSPLQKATLIEQLQENGK